MLPHITPSEWILSGLILGCILLCLAAEIRPRRRDRDRDEPPGSSDEEDDRDVPLAA